MPDNQPNGQQDNLIAGKYKTTEDLHKGIINKLTQTHGEDLAGFYKNLEAGKVIVGEQQTTTPKQEGAQMDLTINKPAVTLDTAKSEIQATGEISKETYAELSKTYPKDALDLSITSLKSAKTSAETTVYETVGGKDNYSQMAEWAKTGLSAEELSQYNEAVSSGNPFIQKAAVQTLQNAFTKANGTGGERIQGDLSGDLNTNGYKNHREMVDAMKDPKYNTDSAYRSEVEAKAKVSKF